MRNAINFVNKRTGEFATAFRMCCRRYCTGDERYTGLKKKKVIHPYCQIHPWNSKKEFADNLVKNVIYNKDGLVAINKPYGIAVHNNVKQQNQSEDISRKTCHKIVREVNYSIEDVLPYLAKELDVPQLIPYLTLEKYMTGVLVFGTDDKICQQISKARKRVARGQYRKYWVVTSRVPNSNSGSHHLAMIMETLRENKKPVIVTKWSSNAQKKGIVKILNINYKILSNSTYNLSSLIEIDASTEKWHCIRLFASTMLYSPILGDNYHGSRVQEIMGTWMRVNTFAESTSDLPKLNKELLNLLDVRHSQQEIIPTHIHKRAVTLPLFGVKKEDLVLEAPIIHPFDWTCKQLMFKNVPYAVDDANTEQETANNHEIEIKAESRYG